MGCSLNPRDQGRAGRFMARFVVLTITCTGCFVTATAQNPPPLFKYRPAMDSLGQSLGYSLNPGFVSGSRAKDVLVEDLDGDGWLDIYLPRTHPVPFGNNFDVIFKNNQNIRLDLLSSEPAFALISTSQAFTFPGPLTTSRSYDVEAADLNQDGVLDIIRPDRGSLVVLWGNPNAKGTFNKMTDLLAMFGGDPNSTCTLFGTPVTGGNYTELDVADRNRDGSPAFPAFFAVAQWHSCGDSFFVENLGPASCVPDPNCCKNEPLLCQFELHILSPLLKARNTHGVSLGFVDDNDAEDLLLAHRKTSSTEPEAYLASGAVTFQGLSSPPFPFEEPPESGLTSIAEFIEADGLNGPDVYIVREPGAFLVRHGIYLHDGSSQGNPYPTFIAGVDPIGARALYDVRAADVDQDGQIEIISAAIRGSASDPSLLLVERVTGSSPNQDLEDFTSEFVDEHHGGTGIDLGDLDNDGDEDLVLSETRDDFSSAAAHIYENRTFTVLVNRTLTGSPEPFVGFKSLTAGSAVVVQSGANVVFESRDLIVLQPGFSVQSGATFTARIFSTSN